MEIAREANGATRPAPTGEEDVVTASQARDLLGIGHTRFAQLLGEWEATRKSGLPWSRSTIDRRVRLVKRADVLALLEQSRGMTVEQARQGLGVSHNKILALIASGALPVRANPLQNKQRLVDPERYAALLTERRALQRRNEDSPGRPE